MSDQNAPLILASASSARAHVLTNAGIPFFQESADVDEGVIKEHQKKRGAGAPETALALAEAKAAVITARHQDAWVIGADQILVCGERWFDKPIDQAEAVSHLKALRGRRHDLISAVCVARGGTTVWRHVETTSLSMLNLSDGFIEDYMVQAGPEVLESVGAYRLEGVGAQLFSEIEGDYFTILGLPLLPLLAFLREAGVMAQ